MESRNSSNYNLHSKYRRLMLQSPVSRTSAFVFFRFTDFQLLYLLSDQSLWFVQIDFPKPSIHFWRRDRLLQNCHPHMWSDHRGYYIRIFYHNKSSYIHQFQLRKSQTFYSAISKNVKRVCHAYWHVSVTYTCIFKVIQPRLFNKISKGVTSCRVLQHLEFWVDSFRIWHRRPLT